MTTMWQNNTKWLPLSLLGCICLFALPAGAEEDGGDDTSKETASSSSDDDIERIEVTSRETLGSIALRERVSVSKLEGWNDLELGEAREGMKLIVKSDEKVESDHDKPLPVVHVIQKGDTLSEIAGRYHVSARQIQQWNPDLDPRYLQLGDRLKLYVPGRDGESVSWGQASNGRLYNGVPLRRAEGFEIVNVAEAYGTQRVVDLLKAAAADVQARWPRSPDLIVGDLSHKQGGPMPPHKSHESGRDADVGFYHRGNVQLERFREMTPETFDARKNWHFLKTLIDTGEIEYIFVIYELQKQLYEYARSIGYTQSELKDLMQYPRPRYQSKGIIRHVGGHDDHSHIRFKCGPDDRRCQ